MSGQERKTPSELDAILADYHHTVKDSWMQAIIRRREKNVKYIQMEAAHASEVRAHIPTTYYFLPNILLAESCGGQLPAFQWKLQQKKCTRPGIGPTAVRQ